MSTALYVKKRRKTEINIVPLIDVLIVLIFFFLMTMQFRNLPVLDITPPKVETAGKGEVDQAFIIGISPEGTFFIGEREVAEAELIAEIQTLAKKDPETSVLLMADENVPLKHVTLVMDESRKAGLQRIRLQTR
jgi:biopolymer transport protein ExbD